MNSGCFLNRTKYLFFFLICFAQVIWAQRTLESQIADSLTAIANKYTFVGKMKLQSVVINPKNSSIVVTASPFLAYMPFRADNVDRIYKAIRQITADKYPGYSISCLSDGKPIEDLVPNYYRSGLLDSSRIFPSPRLPHPLVTDLSRPYDISSGLLNRHIALWQSHGKYYDQKRSRWTWQRSHLFQTVEDLYTQSFVLPFLVPMLENAGANVLLPRERDTQLHEVIVDNDSNATASKESKFREKNNRKAWTTLPMGFANLQRSYLHGENPFLLGTYKGIEAVSEKSELSTIEWVPDIPADGKYAVYISYKSLPNSATDAHYTVYHKGQKNEFLVNQSMGGSTWIYLGHFYFDKGRNNKNRIVLSNLSAEDGKVITADAVKIGGGMGNMARARFVEPAILVPALPTDSSSVVQVVTETKPTVVYTPAVSSYPRYVEGARYWLQWAGVPDSVYSRTRGKDDYSDDFQSRGFWVNYIAGGSVVNPSAAGLKIPIDLAFAFHSDAGLTNSDSIIGTLAINTIPNTWGSMQFQNGTSRWASRDLADIVQTQIVADVQKKFAPEWTRRGMWDKSYSEARVPEVPTMLLELLSHQNFADMRYGLDPRFRFAVSRAIYKGMLRYLSTASQQPYIVQPLPVEQFSCHFVAKNKVQLHWEAVVDSLEPTAEPEQYRLYTKVDDGDFDNGMMLHSNTAIATLETGKIYSFKVVAVNKGGQSFPSEVLSAYKAPVEKGQVLIVNAFDRLSAPVGFEKDTTDAAYAKRDPGVAYQADISYVGKPKEFKLNVPSIRNADQIADTIIDTETMQIAGNTFDYPYVHGKAIKAAGYSFASVSAKALTSGYVDLTSVKNIDLILGKQKQTFIGNAKKAAEFKTFPLDLQRVIESFCSKGGNVLLSGAFVGSDALNNDFSGKNKRFVENVLHFKCPGVVYTPAADLEVVDTSLKLFRQLDMSFYNQPNSERYYLESVDVLEPINKQSSSICRYASSKMSAGVAYNGKYKVCSFGFPLETIQNEKDLSALMHDVLQFFSITK